MEGDEEGCGMGSFVLGEDEPKRIDCQGISFSNSTENEKVMM